MSRNPYVDEHAPPPPDWHANNRGDPPGHWSTACPNDCPAATPTDDRDLEDIPAIPADAVPPIFVACPACAAPIGVACSAALGNDPGHHGDRYAAAHAAAGWLP